MVKRFFFISFFLMLVLLFFQYKTTKPTDFRNLSEMEKIAQLRRMNEYTPSSYRLANLIEARPEAVVYFKLEKNFLDVFDLPSLFTIYIYPIFLPFFFIGFFEALRTRPKQVLLISSLPVLLLTLIGHQNTKGPFCLFPIIYAASGYGMIIIIRAALARYEK